MKKSDDHLFEDDEQEDHIIRNSCARFHGEDNNQHHFKDAVAYLVLRKEGCPRKDALLFASKNCCRVDTTKEKNGPRDYRALKLQQTPNYMVQSGWLYGQYDFQLGKCFQPRYSRSYQEALNDDKMEENFNEQEVKMRKEYKKMIKRMKEYVKQINSKYELAEKKGKNLIEAVKQIVSGMKKELENRFYLTVNNIRYFDIAETIAHKTSLSDQEKNNLIEKLNVFNNLENEFEFTSQQIFKLEEDETNTHLMKNNNTTNTAPPDNQQGLSEKLPHQPLVKISPWENMGEAQRQQQLASLEESIQYAAQLKNLESATKLLEDFDKTEGDELSKPAGRFDRTYEIKRKLRQAQMKNNLEMVKEESQAGLEGQFNQQKYFFTHEEKQGGNLKKEQREKEELQNYIFNTYCQAIDDIFQQNYEKFREIQKTKDLKQSQSNNTQLKQDQISTFKQDTDCNKQSYYSKQARQNVRLSSSLTELDMAAISNLKEKQESQLVSFKQKVQPLRIFKRNKGIMIQPTRTFHKSADLRGTQNNPEKTKQTQSLQNEIQVNPFQQGEKDISSSINVLNISQNRPPSPQNNNQFNVSLRNIISSQIKHKKYTSKLDLKTQPSLRELTKGATLSGYLPQNQSLSVITPFERFSQLSTKSASQKNILLDLSSGQIQNTEKKSQKDIRKQQIRTNSNFFGQISSNGVENLPKKPLALTPQGTRVLKNSYISSSTRIPSALDVTANQQCDSQNSLTTPSQLNQQKSQVKGNTINNNSSLVQLFTSPANSIKPSFSSELSSAWHLPKHKPADLTSIASTPSRQLNRTVHITGTTTHSTAGSIQSFSPPLFKIPNKVKRNNDEN